MANMYEYFGRLWRPGLLLFVATLVILCRRNFRGVVEKPAGVVKKDAVSPGHVGAHVDRESKNVTLPNILLIGTQKSGSTSLAKWIFRHDGVCGAGSPPEYTKEVHFFDHPERYQQGVSAYHSLYSSCNQSSLVLDATPSNYLFPDRVRKIYDDAGGMHAKNLKIVVTVRDPAARELSIYNHMADLARTRGADGWWRLVIKDDGSIMDFSEYVSKVTMAEIKSETSVSLYAHNLRRWMAAFDRGQILVLSYDELKDNPNKLLTRLREFFGLNEGMQDLQLRHANQHNSKEKVALPPCKEQEKILNVLSAENDALFELLHERPGPPMEQRPFPKFVISNCSSVAGTKESEGGLP